MKLEILDKYLVYYAEVIANGLDPISSKDTMRWIDFCKAENPGIDEPWY